MISKKQSFPWKMLVGTVIIVAALGLLIVPSLQSGAQYYLTVEELLADPERFQQETVRISGAVIGQSITWDPETDELLFTIASVPADLDDVAAQGGFQASMHQAVTDPARARVVIHAYGSPPELLQDEAQAILTGRLGVDGIFQADDILLKCPSRYQEEEPQG